MSELAASLGTGNMGTIAVMLHKTAMKNLAWLQRVPEGHRASCSRKKRRGVPMQSFVKHIT